MDYGIHYGVVKVRILLKNIIQEYIQLIHTYQTSYGMEGNHVYDNSKPSDAKLKQG